MNADDHAPILEVSDAGKRFCRRLGRSLRYGAADIARELVGLPPPRILRRDEFWAVDGVSFSLRRGECLGLIGANGAGKSTLLKMIAGLIKPDRGSITVRGRVGALIELGAGMHPLLSGRENIRLNAAILGLSRREVEARMEQIIAFADIGEFIDAPVQSYSSGMRVRLGFAVAAHLEPDLLLIDEVLAVGDVHFRMRCLERIKMLQGQGIGMVLVSHNLNDIVRACRNVVVLDHGRVIEAGGLQNGIAAYHRSLGGRESDCGAPGPRIVQVQHRLESDTLRLELEVRGTSEHLRILLVLCSIAAGPLGSVSSHLAFPDGLRVDGATRVSIALPLPRLLQGWYEIKLHLKGAAPHEHFATWEGRTFFSLSDPPIDPDGFGYFHVLQLQPAWEVVQ